MEAITKLTAFRGFAGTSVLIIVGVATDTARKVLLVILELTCSNSDFLFR